MARRARDSGLREAVPRRRRPKRAWDHAELSPVSARPPFIEYLHQLWDRRHFIRMHAFSQAMGANQGTWLGRAWLVLAPLLDGLVYWLVFGVVFQASKGVPDFIPRLIIGILLFSYVSRSLLGATGSMQSGRGLIRAFSFPRASLPISAVLRETFGTAPTIVTLLIMIAAIPPHSLPTSTWLIIPIPFLLITAMLTGIGLILARLASLVPDINKLLGYGLRLLMYGSGVIFAVDRFQGPEAAMTALRLNPVNIFLEMMRDLLLYNRIPPPFQWGRLAAWAVATLLIGLIFFWRGEASYGRQRVA